MVSGFFTPPGSINASNASGDATSRVMSTAAVSASVLPDTLPSWFDTIATVVPASRRARTGSVNSLGS